MRVAAVRGRSLAAALLALLASCSDGVGPGPLAFNTCLDAAALDARAIQITSATSARIVAVAPATGTVLGDTVVPLPTSAAALTLPVVGMAPSGLDTARVTAALLTASQGIVFRIGPLDLSVSSATLRTCVPIPAPQYTGPGAGATAIRIVSAPRTVRTLDSFTVVAAAVDSDGAVVPDAPILWGSEGGAASVPDFRTGHAVAGSARGTAVIVAELLSQQSLRLTVRVEPPPSGIRVMSGGGQSGTVAAPLAQPVDLSVQAGDGLGVEGVLVRLAASHGGAAQPDSARSDSTGHLSVTWTLGTRTGTQTLTATLADAAGDSTHATALAGAARRLAFVSAPRPGLVEGDTFSLRVEVQDSLGNIASTFTGPVTLALATGRSATLGGPLTASAVAGVAAFDGLSVDRGGTDYSLAANATDLRPDTSAHFDVTGIPVALAFTQQPNNANRYYLMASARCLATVCLSSFAVSALDRFAHVVAAFHDTVIVTLGRNPVGATLGLRLAAVDGVARGSFALQRGAGYTLIARSGTLPAVESAPFTFSGDPPERLLIATPYPAPKARAPFTIGVDLLDFEGVVTADVSGGYVVLRVDSGPSGSTVTGGTRMPLLNGTASFPGLVAYPAGRYWLSAAQEGNGFRTTSPTALDVAAADPHHIAFVAPVPTRRVGTPFGVPVEVRDAGDARATTYNGTVTLALGANPAGATLGGTLTVAAVSGAALFPDVTVDRAGTGFTLTASATGLVAGLSGPFNTSDLALAFATPPPASTGPGVLPEIVVEARDALGARAASYADTISLSVAEGPAGAMLGGATSIVAAGGVARFSDVRVSVAGAGYRLQATAARAAAATSDAFVVTPGGGAHLAFITQPVLRRTGSPAQPRVEATVAVVDSLGNVFTTFADTVTVRLAPHVTGSDTLFAAGRAAPSNGTGRASFSLTRPWMPGGGFQLVAEAAGLGPATSAGFDVPVQFPLATEPKVQPPASIAAGTPFGVSFTAVDLDGFPLPDSMGVRLLVRRFTPDTDWQVVDSLPAVTGTRGVAAFPAVVVRTPGDSYDLLAVIVGVPRNAGGYYRLVNSWSFAVVAPPGAADGRTAP